MAVRSTALTGDAPAVDAGARRIPLESASCLFCDAATPFVVEARGLDYEYNVSDDVFTFARCTGCNHWFLNPRPSPSAASLLYGGSYYTQTAEHQTGMLGVLGMIKDFVLRRRIRELIDRLPRGAALLEVGCGDGALLLALRGARADLRLSGLDVTLSSNQEARLRAAGIDCVTAQVENAQLPEASFDAILMNQVIEHVWEPRAALVQLKRALIPHGRLILSTPNLDGYDRRLFRRSCWGGYYMPRHLNLFTRESLTRLLEESGFRDISVRSLTAPLVWVRSIQYTCRSRGIPGAGLFADANLPALALFAFIDRLAIAAGAQTSNMHAVARRD